MINPQTLVDEMVARLRAIPELQAVFPSQDQIRAYHHDFAQHTQWLRELMRGDPGLVVRWSGTAPANGRPFVHSFEAAVRVGEYSVPENGAQAIYQVWTGFVNGKPNGNGGCCDRNWVTPLTNDVLPMNPPAMRPVTDAEGQDYWLITYSIQEKGDTC